RSTRTYLPPASEPMTVRSALAVRPLRPITFPRSSGWTRTSSTLPLRSLRALTWTSSPLATMPLTRCSSASSSTSGLALGLLLGLGGLLGRLVGLLLGLLGLALALVVGQHELLEHGLEGGLLGLLVPGLGDLERLLRLGQALELLPVAGALQDGLHRVGGLGPLRQPVLRPVGPGLDEGGVLIRVVLGDLLDGLAIAVGEGVGDDDAVVRRTDLPHTLELDLDGHGVVSPAMAM